MIIAVLIPFLVALPASLFARLQPRLVGPVLALVPASLFVYFLTYLPAISASSVAGQRTIWMESLGVSLSFYLDGLSLLLALIITLIGTLVFLYAGSYLKGEAYLGRFYTFILMFMGSMLGLVLADNLILLFVFWELTSVTSYLLIGYKHEDEKAQKAALQAMVVTGVGGLAMLAGFILLGVSGGSFEFTDLLVAGSAADSPLYLPILLLMLLGVFTKSAQAPFHIWLPSAMQAPTPVSAYLHSATMVKAGIYLLARMTPILGGTDLWHNSLAGIGAVTMLLGAAACLIQTDLKRLLAFSTVSALGTLTLLLGLNTDESAKAALVFLTAHAFYNGAMFLGAGIIDHETGSRDIRNFSGLIRVMPITGLALTLAALSMAGLPPLFGFIGKELLYEAKLQAPTVAWLVTGCGVVANVGMVAAAGQLSLRVLYGRLREEHAAVHEPSIALWLGPVVLAALGVLCGILPNLTLGPVLSQAIAAVRAEETSIALSLWHGINPMLILSVVTVVLGLALYLALPRMVSFFGKVAAIGRLGPTVIYDYSMNVFMVSAKYQTRFWQTGYLRYYLLFILAFALAAVGMPLWQIVAGQTAPLAVASWGFEIILTAVILGAALGAAWARNRLTAVAMLGVVGYGISLVFVLNGAPDLAITQFAIETLTVVLFVLVIYKLPKLSRLSRAGSRLRDAAIAVAFGATMTTVILLVVQQPMTAGVSSYLGAVSQTLAKGKNVVNVILVDFRALDTLGELLVLGVGALGVYSMTRFLRSEDTDI